MTNRFSLIFRYFRQSKTKTVLVLATSLVTLSWLGIALSLWQLPPQIPIFYTFTIQSQQLAVKWWILLIPILQTCLLLGNILIDWFLSKESLLFRLLFWWTSIVFLSLLSVAGLRIVWLVS